MGLDQYGQLRNTQIDFEKYYNDKNYDPTKDGFVWRKHAQKKILTNIVEVCLAQIWTVLVLMVLNIKSLSLKTL
jgi:hypothetical protein